MAQGTGRTNVGAAALRWEPGGPFWQRHPNGALSMPFINAMYIPDLKPVIGREIFNFPTKHSYTINQVFQLEQFLHESGHIHMRHTPLGRDIQDIAVLKYSILHNLKDDMTLFIPSWRISGSPEISAFSAQLPQLLELLVSQTTPVEETLCSLLTLHTYHTWRAKT